MIKCNECTHFHDQTTRLFCDAGVMDVTIVGGAKCVAEMRQCDRFEPNQEEKIDKRTKEWKQSNG